MAEIASPSTLEAFAESRVKALLEAQVTRLDDSAILCGHTRDEWDSQEGTAIICTVTRLEEDPPGSDTGWWVCEVSAELDPRDMGDDDAEATWTQIETALGNGDGDIETQLTNGRLACMAGSVIYDQELAYDVGERLLTFGFTASLGLLAP